MVLTRCVISHSTYSGGRDRKTVDTSENLHVVAHGVFGARRRGRNLNLELLRIRVARKWLDNFVGGEL